MAKKANLSFETIITGLIILVVIGLLIFFAVKYIPQLMGSFGDQGKNAAALLPK